MCWQATRHLLECYCRLVAQYKQQQLLRLVFGMNKNAFLQQNGERQVKDWCTVFFGGTDKAAIATAIGWDDLLHGFLKRHFSWHNTEDSSKVRGGVHVLHYLGAPIPQELVFATLSQSRVFRKVFNSLPTPRYSKDDCVLDIGIANVRPGGQARGLQLQLKTLARVKVWDDRNDVAHMEQLGWDVTDRDVVVPLERCPSGGKSAMLPGTIVSIGKLELKETLPNGLTNRWVPTSKVSVVRKGRGKKGEKPNNNNNNNNNKNDKNKNKNKNKNQNQNQNQNQNKNKNKNQKQNKKICFRWKKNGECYKGDSCGFAHPAIKDQ